MVLILLVIASGLAFDLGIRTASAQTTQPAGTPMSWGYNYAGQLGDDTTTNSTTPVKVSGLTDVTLVEGGGEHSLAISQASPSTSDTTKPTIDEASLAPSKLQTGVQRNTNITATFSEEMNPNTITASTVKLSVYNKKKRKYVPVTNTVVSCDSRPAPCKKVTLDPYGTSSTLLGANKRHKVTITTAVKDKAGNALAQNKIWTFTTGSA
jgi:hypothetical protein